MAEVTRNLAGNKDTTYMDLALAEARQAAELGEIPVGAVLVMGDEIIARAHNERETSHDATAHAEVLVIRAACAKLGRWRLSDATLYVTLEPCPMCAGAIWNARISRVVYGAYDSAAGACGSQFHILAQPALHCSTQVTAGVREQECLQILQDFLKARR